MKKKFLLPLFLILMLFSGCSSLDTAVRKRDLATQTRLSETIWLNPDYIGDKTIFVQIKNTSTNYIDIENDVKQLLTSKGYKVVNNPKNANYWLQGNILKLEKMNKDDGDAAFNALTGAGVGALIGGYNTGSANTAVAWGLVGGAASVVANALVNDTYYTMITDILVSERTPYTVKNTSINTMTQGGYGGNISTSNSTTNMNKYQTRVISTANKVNLEFYEAEPQLKNELLKVISNIF